MSGTATLFVIGTPIGNLEDISYRAVRVLGEIDALACEDTRRTRTLLDRYEISRPATVFSLHEHNEERAAKRVLGLLDAGSSVGMCSDAGMPLINDPGFPTVQAAIEAGHPVVAIPGPTAAATALAVAGLPTASFTFKGFAPRKQGKRQRFLREEAESEHTLVLYESPHRIGALLQDALAVLGDRSACVCLELTKKFETVHRGSLSTLCELHAGAVPKGEITVVIAGNHRKWKRDVAAAGESPPT